MKSAFLLLIVDLTLVIMIIHDVRVISILFGTFQSLYQYRHGNVSIFLLIWATESFDVEKPVPLIVIRSLTQVVAFRPIVF